MAPKDVDLQVKLNWVNKEIESLANSAIPGLSGDSWVFKTESLVEAKEIHWKARRIVELAFPGRDEMYLDISIVSQPESSECGFLGHFSDDYCSRCGGEMLEQEYIEPEEE